MSKVNPVKRTGSASGFHYINLFQLCPRKFYFRHVLRWRPEHTALQLVQGSAVHEGKATWYLTKSKKKALDMAKRVLDESAEEIAVPAELDWVAKRIPVLLSGWIDTWGKRDLEEFKVVAVEKELKVPVGDTGFIFTMRPDTILQSKSTKLVHIMETKTSGFSKRVTEEGVYYGDQATAYIWGVQKVMGLEVFGVQPDIAYWNSRATDVNNIDYPRTPMVFRSPYQLQMFEAAMAQLMTEATQKVEALDKGFAPEVLFPRNSFYCVAYNKVCEYAAVCGKPCTKKTRIPAGFIKEKPTKLGDFVADTLGSPT